MLSLTSLHISYIITGTILVVLGLYGAYKFTGYDPFIFFWIITFIFGYSVIQYGIVQLCKRII